MVASSFQYLVHDYDLGVKWSMNHAGDLELKMIQNAFKMFEKNHWLFINKYKILIYSISLCVVSGVICAFRFIVEAVVWHSISIVWPMLVNDLFSIYRNELIFINSIFWFYITEIVHKCINWISDFWYYYDYIIAKMCYWCDVFIRI